MLRRQIVTPLLRSAARPALMLIAATALAALYLVISNRYVIDARWSTGRVQVAPASS